MRILILAFVMFYAFADDENLALQGKNSSEFNSQSTNLQENLSEFGPQNSNSQENSIKFSSQSTNLPQNSSKTHTLEASVITATSDETKRYNSGSVISKDLLDSTPSGNGDIGSVLKILPNVQFDNLHSKSATPGEIDPANISISGGLYYQNNFQLDGFNINNDLTSNLIGDNGVNGTGTKSSKSQAFSIDTSLLESILVQDSNIGAAYGGFTGGVVEAKIRKPRNDGLWHGNLSYQFTQGNANGFSLTRYIIDPEAEQNFLNSTSEYYHPKFTKHLIRASLEGFATQNLGVLASFATTQSFIPLFVSNPTTYTSGTNAKTRKNQKRQNYNYFLKAYYNPSVNLNIEASVAYMPQYNSYFFSGGAYNADYVIESGGYQTGIKAMYQTPIGLSITSLGYAYQKSERSADSNYSYYALWFVSDGANYSRSDANAAAIYTAANYGNMRQSVHIPTFKEEFLFNPIPAWRSEHHFALGVEFSYQSAVRQRLNPYVQFANDNNIPVPSSTPCPNTPDNLGFIACINGKPFQNPNVAIRSNNTTYQQYTESSKNQQVKDAHTGVNSWATGYDNAVAQYYNIITQYYGTKKIKLENFAYAAFIEDDVEWDLDKFGGLNTRFGLRFEDDNYMDKNTIAPRFSFSYISPAPTKWQTTLTLGANRYYGRNLFSYRFLDFASPRISYKRDCASCDWYEIELNSSLNPPFTSSVKFNELKIPYSDEFMAGISNNLGIFNVNLKYIFRDGRDEIMRVRASRTADYQGTLSGYSTSYAVWTNEGASKSHIISLTLQNIVPIESFGVRHHYLLAFDYTQVNRSYNYYTSDEEDYRTNADILYDGKVMKYRDRPVENFARPWTLRFNMTHSFEIWRTKWMINNFFRFRSGYDKMVQLTKSRNPDLYDSSFLGDQFIKKHIPNAFTWDMRVGFEMRVYNAHTLYFNVDIYNVLNTRNLTTLTYTSGDSYDTGFAYTNAVEAYDVGRQFWLQVGYKF